MHLKLVCWAASQISTAAHTVYPAFVDRFILVGMVIITSAVLVSLFVIVFILYRRRQRRRIRRYQISSLLVVVFQKYTWYICCAQRKG